MTMEYDQLIHELHQIRERTIDIATKGAIDELRWDIMKNGIDGLVDKWSAQQAIEEYGKYFEYENCKEIEREEEKEF